MKDNNNNYYNKVGNYRICEVFFFLSLFVFFLSLYWKEGLSLRTFVREFCFCSTDCLLVVVFIIHHSILFGYSLARNGELLLLQLLPPTVIVVVVIIIVVCRYPCSFLSFPWPGLVWLGLAWLVLRLHCCWLAFSPFLLRALHQTPPAAYSRRVVAVATAAIQFHLWLAVHILPEHWTQQNHKIGYEIRLWTAGSRCSCTPEKGEVKEWRMLA